MPPTMMIPAIHELECSGLSSFFCNDMLFPVDSQGWFPLSTESESESESESLERL